MLHVYTVRAINFATLMLLAQQARMAAIEEATARAEKRPRQYSIDELEALVEKRRKDADLDPETNLTSTCIH